MASMETHKYYNNIMQMYASMLKIYNAQAKLEIEGKIDSEEYKTNYQYLCMIRDHIYNKYEKQEIPIKETNNFLEFLNAYFDEYMGEDDNFLSMISDEQFTCPAYRLYNDLFYYNLNKHIIIIEDGEDEDYNILEQMAIENAEFDELKKNFGYASNDGSGYILHEPEEDEDDEEYEELEELTNNIYLDAFQEAMEIQCQSMDVDLYRIQLHELTLLEYLEDYIKNTTNKHLRNGLIKIKYLLTFTFPSIENKYLRVPETMTSTLILKTAINNYYHNNDQDLKNVFDVEYSAPIEDMINLELETLSNMETEAKKTKDKVKAIMHMLNLKTNISINIDEVIDDNLYELKREAISNATSENSKKLIRESFKTKKELLVTKMLTKH